MPQYKTLAAEYNTEYLPKWQRIQSAESIQKLKDNLERTQRAVEQQQKDIAQNKTVIEKSNLPGLEVDIMVLQGILEKHKKICKNAVGKKEKTESLKANYELIETVKVQISNKRTFITRIAELPDHILPEVKMAQKCIQLQEKNLKKLQQDATKLEEALASREAELKELNLTRHSDMAYVQFFQSALAMKIATALDNTFEVLEDLKCQP